MEGQFINLFRHHIAALLPGHTTCTLWTSLILQAFHEEPAIRFASLAVCTSLALRNRLGTSSVVNAPYSLTQYQRALNSLRTLLSHQDFRSREAVLITCILLMCFEVISGHSEIALLHLDHALQILKKAEYAVDESLVQAYVRLDIQASTYMGDRTPLITLPNEVVLPAIFASLREAESFLRTVQNKLFHFVKSKANVYRYSEPGHIPLEVLGIAKDLQEQLEQWKRAFLSSLKLVPSLHDPKTVGSINLLQIHHLTSTILAANCLHSEETIYDQYDSEFTSIVNLSENLLSLLSPNQILYSTTPRYISSSSSDQWLDKLNFSVDLGIVQPLYVTATKCRIPSLRRHAVSLMRRFSHQEGIWNGPIIAIIAQRVIEVEEGLEEGAFTIPLTGIKPPTFSQATQELDTGVRANINAYCNVASEPRPPEHNRVHGIIREVDNQRFHARVVCHRRPNGMDGEWDYLESFVHWTQEDLVNW
jgi:hypothetical protein